MKLVQTNREEKQKGKIFLRRIKQRWDIEFTQKKRTGQNLVENARRL